MEERKENVMESNQPIRMGKLGMFAIWFILTSQFVLQAFKSLKGYIGISEVSGIIVHSMELVGAITFSLALAKILYNCHRQQVFVRQNIICFRLMYGAYVLPFLTDIIGNIFVSGWEAIRYGQDWVIMFLLMHLISQIFEYGTRLKEEQELTI